MLKAGIIEIGDIFVINKSDLDGDHRAVEGLMSVLELNQQKRDRDTHSSDSRCGSKRHRGVSRHDRNPQRLYSKDKYTEFKGE